MASNNTKWSEKTKKVSQELHSETSISNENWHKYRSDSNRRAIELLTAAIVQIIHNGNQLEIIEKIEQSLKWLKGELKDPGCKEH